MGALNLDFYSLIYRLPAIILALSLHEYAHGRVAYAFGDPTAKHAGRLTLNPLRHLDMLGTVALIFFGFGWAKPVPVNPYYFQGNRAKKMMWVAGAGPLSNLAQALLMAVLLSLLLHAMPVMQSGASAGITLLVNFLQYYIIINLVLAVFNLLPVPPLDGSKILAGLLPERHMHIIYQLEHYGFVILILLMVFGLTSRIISPIVQLLYSGILHLVGLW